MLNWLQNDLIEQNNELTFTQRTGEIAWRFVRTVNYMSYLKLSKCRPVITNIVPPQIQKIQNLRNVMLHRE
jgi:hypothetical protein